MQPGPPHSFCLESVSIYIKFYIHAQIPDLEPNLPFDPDLQAFPVANSNSKPRLIKWRVCILPIERTGTSRLLLRVNELQEIRARQRTFHGAYNRTALGALGYALSILRPFDPRFHRVGLLFVILSALLFIIAFLRSRHSAHDFADRYRGAAEFDVCIKTKGQEDGRIYGRPFKTAGWIVIEVTTVVALAEIALLALIVQHKISVNPNHPFRSSTLTKIPLSCQT